MERDFAYPPAFVAPVEERSAFLRRVALWTFGGLLITTLATLFSMVAIVPAVLKGGTWAILAVVYGSFLGSQTLARGMVYGNAKVPGYLLGCSLQGVALGFLLRITLAMSGVAEGLRTIGYALALTMLASLTMLAYVSIQKRQFSMLSAGLSMAFIPMLILMGLQIVFPIGGTFGLIIAAVFLLVSVATMLWKLNYVLHELPTTRAAEGGYELSLSIVILFWNLLSLMNRLRGR